METKTEVYGPAIKDKTGQVKRVTAAAEWVGWLSKADAFDFYHTWSYHQLHVQHGEPLLFVYAERQNFIAIPFIKRDIAGFDVSDLTSVYGYSGPVSNILSGTIDAGFIFRFRNAFLNFLSEEKIVTLFSGLNPFMDHSQLLDAIGGVTDNGRTVVMDLSLSADQQKLQYRKGVSRKIRILRDKGWTVRQAFGEGAIQSFTEVYCATMERLHAAAGYQFDRHYITSLLTAKEFDARLMFVYDDTGYPVCGAIVIITGQIMQAHLLGTRAEFRNASPAKLLTEELSEYGRALGLKYFNLGGGLSFREDSLFDWKRNFSPMTFEYKTWRYVADEAMYDKIIDYAGIDRDNQIDFFPLYRAESHT